VVKRRCIFQNGDWHRQFLVLRQGVHGISNEPGPEAGIGPCPSHDSSTQRRTRAIAGCGLGRDDSGVCIVGVEVASLSEVAFKDLGPLCRGKLAQGSSRSLSPKSAVRVWSAAGPNRSVAANATV